MLANPEATTETLPYRRLPAFWRGVVVLFTSVGIFLALNTVFHPEFLQDVLLRGNAYLYVLVGIFLSLVFLLFPAHRRDAQHLPGYDVVLFALAVLIPTYFAMNARQLNVEGWAFARPPTLAVVVALIFWAQVLEAARRTSGTLFAGTLLVASLYPSYADNLIGPLQGFSIPFVDTVRFHAFSNQSIIGEPVRVLGTLLIGFLVFGAVLQHSGGGQFFADLASALLGQVRGGAAKVAIVASGAFGMLSGSGVSNVLSTGTVTIPAMKRSGFPPAVAAGIEANAANGGTLVPPVMGATAFLMASVLGVPYSTVAVAAIVPAFLFYFSLFMQLDAYAARYGIRGAGTVGEIPRLGRTLRQGWPYLTTLALLILLIVRFHAEADGAFLAAGVLLILATVGGRLQWSWRAAVEMMMGVGHLLAELTSQLAAVGMLIGALYLTGTVASITSDMLHMAGDNAIALLLIGAAMSFVLGTGLPDTAAYIFLAIMMAPVLVRQGFDPMAVHFFILYWSNIADVTPPVAIAVVAAAGVAQSPVMASMLEATRLAAVKYLLPFFFVFNPVLLLQHSDPITFVAVLVPAVFGIAVAAYGLQGYLPWVGVIADRPLGFAARVALLGGALLFGVPGPLTQLSGLATVMAGYGLFLLAQRLGWRQLVQAPALAGAVQPR